MLRRWASAAVAGILIGTPLLFAGGPVAPGNHPQASKTGSGSPSPAPTSDSSSSQPSASSSGEQHPKCPYTTQECLNSMAHRLKSAGWIGIEYEPKDPDGPKVTKVVPGSPAEKAGLLPGDILFALNGVEMKSANDDALMKARKEWKPGQAVQYTIKRNGASKQVEVVLGEWPADILARYIGEHMLEHAQWDAEDAAKAKAGPPPKKK
ncbi:MAG TPA: PDZ domain-containing protein [Patescibacteria group bacterium]|nr:PDZ domain-containing protein [Patescibacteria group bacterium]